MKTWPPVACEREGPTKWEGFSFQDITLFKKILISGQLFCIII